MRNHLHMVPRTRPSISASGIASAASVQRTQKLQRNQWAFQFWIRRCLHRAKTNFMCPWSMGERWLVGSGSSGSHRSLNAGAVEFRYQAPHAVDLDLSPADPDASPDLSRHHWKLPGLTSQRQATRSSFRQHAQEQDQWKADN